MQFMALKLWYENDYVPQKSNLLPFIKLKATKKTFESEGGDYLSEKEVSCYLSEGVVGPLSIKSLTHKELNSIYEQFSDFNSNRNLGSVYSMLTNRCMINLATNPAILAKVSSILGNNIMLANMTVNSVQPSQGKSTTETKGLVDSLNCHSDLSSGSQYHFEIGTNCIKNLTLNNRCVHVWLSITGTDATNAPLYFFPKTHLWEISTPFTYLDLNKHDPDSILKLLSFKQGSAARRIGLYNEEYKYLLYSRYKPLLSNIRQTEIYTQPGECIFFNAHTKHGSGVNSSAKTRVAITMRYNTAMTEAGGLESAGSVVTLAERKTLGILGDKRKPMIQVMGNKHHINNLPINISHLY
jgi:ectoine hydroxylase-related dioxygenase (phytanoyl-CoA dioxygenase family)